MKKFLCYDTEAAARGEINVDSRGMLKPTTPSAQADWNENDSSSPAYILNKPENLGGGGSDSVVWFSFSGSNFSSAYDSGDWKVGREWQAENGNPTPEDILNAYENNKTIRATVYYRDCTGLNHCENTMIGLRFNADNTFAKAYFTGDQTVYMTCIPYTKQ